MIAKKAGIHACSHGCSYPAKTSVYHPFPKTFPPQPQADTYKKQSSPCYVSKKGIFIYGAVLYFSQRTYM